MPLGEWFHLVVIYEDGNLFTYINDTASVSSTDPRTEGVSLSEGATTFTVGYSPLSFAMAELEIFNSALNMDQVEAVQSFYDSSEGKACLSWRKCLLFC